MKRCPECGRDYNDDSLSFCLDDGSELLFGPKSFDEPATAILPEAPTKIGERPEKIRHGASGRSKWAIAVIAILILITSASWWYLRSRSDSSVPQIRSLAVLPLENLSGDASQEYFADGMTDALINNLSRFRSLKVISRTSTMRYKNATETLPTIAAALGVDAVIEGSVQRSGDRVRITAQLIPANTDSPIWSRNYERQMSDVLKLESDVARSIADEIRLQLTSAERDRLDSAKTIDPEAHDAYLLGQASLNKLNPADLAKAVGYFQQATAIDPSFADAWAGLAQAWLVRGVFGGATFVTVESSARAAAARALELDPRNSQALAAMSTIKLTYDLDWPGAEAAARGSIESDPNNAGAYVTLSWVLQTIGRFTELHEQMDRAEQLDPVSSNYQSDYGRMLYRGRNYREAEMHLKRALELDPDNSTAMSRLADLYCAMGDYDRALSTLEEVEKVSPSDNRSLRMAVVWVHQGRRKDVMRVLQGSGKGNSFQRARIYAALGDNDKVFEILQNGIDSHTFLISNAIWDPSFDPVHDDPRWPELLDRLKLPKTRS